MKKKTNEEMIEILTKQIDTQFIIHEQRIKQNPEAEFKLDYAKEICYNTIEQALILFEANNQIEDDEEVIDAEINVNELD